MPPALACTHLAQPLCCGAPCVRHLVCSPHSPHEPALSCSAVQQRQHPPRFRPVSWHIASAHDLPQPFATQRPKTPHACSSPSPDVQQPLRTSPAPSVAAMRNWGPLATASSLRVPPHVCIVDTLSHRSTYIRPSQGVFFVAGFYRVSLPDVDRVRGAQGERADWVHAEC